MNKPTKYIRLLSYDNACKVQDFIIKNCKKDYAYITSGGLAMQVADKNWEKIVAFIKSLGVRYEIGFEPPYKVVAEIVSNLKKEGII